MLELIERRGGGHEHSAGRPIAAARAPCTLPRGRDRSRITGHHARVQRADINAQFQRIRGDHAAHAPFAKAAFDFAPLSRQISAAIAANRFGFSGLRREGLLQIGEQDFGVQAAIGEDDRLQLAREKFLGHARGFVQVAAANAEIFIHHRRIVKDEKLFRRGRAIFLDGFHFGFRELAGEFGGIGNRVARAQQMNCGCEP